VLLAVLLSVIYSPYLLTLTIAYYNKKQQKDMDAHLKQYEDTNLHPLYFAINTKSRGSWGHQDKILKKLFNLNMEIIDFRSWHAPEHNTTHHMPLTKDSFYIQDMDTALPPTKHLDGHEKSVLLARVKVIRAELRDALGESAVISVKRWLPGVTKKDDQLDPTDAYHKSMFGGDYKPKHKKTAEYCRQSAFKQANSMISVFERRNTLEDLARKSKASIQSMYHNRTMSDVDRERTMKELGNLQSLSNLLVAAEMQDMARGGDSDDSVSANGHERKETKNQKLHRQLSQHISFGCGGFDDASAGGAGAVPVTSDIINIVHSHFEEEETLDQHQNETSHMSYIYGQEESRQHAGHLPEYSHQPNMPDLDEDAENDNDVVMGTTAQTGDVDHDDVHGHIVSAFKQ